MPVSWYDRAENEGGHKAAKIGFNVKDASALVSTYIPILISNFSTLFGGISICLLYLWQLGLLSLFSVPMIAIGGYIAMLFIGGYEDETLDRHDGSDRIANETIVNIKTVLALNCQNLMTNKYISLL